jgi:hypothetical protein
MIVVSNLDPQCRLTTPHYSKDVVIRPRVVEFFIIFGIIDGLVEIDLPDMHSKCER